MKVSEFHIWQDTASDVWEATRLKFE